jgi:hypothetical protein
VATLRRLVDAVNRSDIPGQLSVFTDDAVVIGGPCGGPPANGECVGQTQIQAALQQGGTGVSVALSNIQVVGDGNTVTFRTTEAFPLPPEVTATGIHGQKELGTAVLVGGKIDRLALVVDVTDPQSVALQRLFAQMGPGPSSTSSTVTSDGQSLATQSPATQAQFRATYGDQAATQWAAQHQAALSH